MKRFYYILVCIVMMLSFAGCTAGSDKDDKEPVKQETQQETEKDENSEDGQGELDAEAVDEYFPQDDKYRTYNGYAEAGFEVKFLGKETDDGGSIEYKYKGAMNGRKASRPSPPVQRAPLPSIPLRPEPHRDGQGYRAAFPSRSDRLFLHNCRNY